ncbi:MAG: hypothetical protein AAGA17_06510 [Actinomycetota bacterium]
MPIFRRSTTSPSIIATTLVSLTAVGALALGGPASANTVPPEDRCVATAGGSADSIQARIDQCRAEVRATYVDCLRSQASAPDVMLRYVGVCLARATP